MLSQGALRMRPAARILDFLPWLIVLAGAFGSLSTKAQTVFTYTGSSADWSTAAWAKSGTPSAATYPGQIPGEDHQAVIMMAFSTLNLDVDIANTSLRSVSVWGGTLLVDTNRTLVVTSGNIDGTGAMQIAMGTTVTVGGNLTISGTTVISGSPAITVSGNLSGILQLAGSTLTLNGSTQSLTSTNPTLGNLVVNSGSTTTTTGHIHQTGNLAVNGSFTTQATDSLRFSGSTISGSGTIALGILKLVGAGNKTASSSFSIRGASFNNEGAGTFTAASNTRVTFARNGDMDLWGSGTGLITLGNVTLNGGTSSRLNLRRTLVLTGTASGTAANGTDAALGIGSTSNGMIVFSSATVTFSGTGASFVSSSKLNPGSGLINIDADNFLLASATNLNNLAVKNGRSFSAGVKMRFAGYLYMEGAGTFTQTADTAHFTSAGGQTINTNSASTFNFNHLSLEGGGTKTLARGITVNGSLIIKTGVTLNAATFNINLYGHWLNSGTFSFTAASTQTVNFLGGATQSLAGNTTFRNISLGKTGNTAVEATGRITVGNATVIAAASALDLMATASHALGTVSGTGTLRISAAAAGNTDFPSGIFTNFLAPTGTGTVEYNGTPSFNVAEAPPLDYYNLIISGGGVKTLTAPIRVRSTLTINSGATLHNGIVTLEMRGNLVNNGTFDGGSGGDLFFASTTAAQYIQGSGTNTLNVLRMDKTGQTMYLQSPVSINTRINFQSDGLLDIGTSNVTLGPSAVIITNTTFGPACMIRQDGTAGTGALIKQGTTTAGLLFVFPIGTGSLYTPAEVTILSASVAGTGSISVKVIPFSSPKQNELKRFWRIQTSNISTVTDARLEFNYSAAEVVGSPNSVVRKDIGGVDHLVNGDFFNGIDKFGVNSSGNTFLEYDWYFSKPNLSVTYYSYQTGDFTNPTTWTTDFTGATYMNPPDAGGPDSDDKVVILTGKTVTVDANTRIVDSVHIRSGATLVLGTTTGHDFGYINGNGTMRMSNGSFPIARLNMSNSFIGATGGTMEYTSFTGNIPDTVRTYYKLIFSGTGTKTLPAAVNTTFAIYTDLSVTGGGFVIGSSTATITLTIATNFNVSAGATVGVGNTNAIHDIQITGNLVNNGTIRFTNQASPAVAAYFTATTATGAALVQMLGSANSVITANGITDFYYLRMMKGNPTYSLSVNASAAANFGLYGRNDQADPNQTVATAFGLKALRLDQGIFITNANVVVPSLTTGNDFRVSSTAVWRIQGSTVTVTTGASNTEMALRIYGSLIFESGTINGGGGIGLRLAGDGIWNQQGGTATFSQVTTYRGASLVVTADFLMSAGTLNVDGSGGTLNTFPRFCLGYSAMTYVMTGGTVNMASPVSSATVTNGGLLIMANTLSSVTGGAWNFIIPNSAVATENFGINSVHYLYSATFTSTAATRDARLVAISYNDGVATTYTQTARQQYFLTTFTLNNFAVFNCNAQNTFFGSDFTVNATANYLSGGTPQVTRFGTSQTGQTAVINITLNQPNPTFFDLRFDNSLTHNLIGNNITVQNDLIGNGGSTVINDGGKTITVYRNVNSSSLFQGTGRIIMYGTTAALLNGASTGRYNILELNKWGAGRTVTMSGNQQMNTELIITRGILDCGAGVLLIPAAALATVVTPGDTSHIATSGAGSFRKTFNAATRTMVMHLGFGGKYRKVEPSYTATTYGYVQIRGVNASHPNLTIPPATTDSAAFVYWVITCSGWGNTGTVPNLKVHYLPTDMVGGSATEDDRYVIGTLLPGPPPYWGNTSTYTQPEKDANYFTITAAYHTALGVAVNNLAHPISVGRLVAFGGYNVFESIASGLWQTPGTWKQTKNGIDVPGQNPSTTAPGQYNPIVIRNNTVVTVNAATGTITSPSLKIDLLGTLELGTTLSTAAHNFTTVQDGSGGGNGTVRASSSTATPNFPGGVWTNMLDANGGWFIWYRSGVDFTLPTSYGGQYRNLILKTDGGTITGPPSAVAVNDSISIQAATAGTFALNNAALGNFTISGNTYIRTNATLLFQNSGTARTWACNRVENRGSVLAQSGGSNLNHLFSVNRDLYNYGTWDLFPTNGTQNRGYVRPNGDYNTVIAGTGPIFRNTYLVSNRGTGFTTTVTVSNFQLSGEAAGSTKPIHMSGGTLIMDVPGTYTLNSGASSTQWVLPNNAVLELRQGRFITTATANNILRLEGQLRLIGTTQFIWKTAGSDDASWQLGGSGIPNLVMSADSLVIGGQFRSQTGQPLKPCSLTVTSGTMMVAYQAAPVATKPIFEVSLGSVVTQSGGRIILCRSNANIPSVYWQPGTATITGGALQLGHTWTPTATAFTLNNNITFGVDADLYDLTLHAPAAAAVKPTLTLSGALITKRHLTLDAGTRLQTAHNNVTVGGNFVANGKYYAGTNTTTFNSTGIDQNITGTGFDTVQHMVINPAVNTIDIVLGGASLYVKGNLTITAGQLDANTRHIQVKGNVTNQSVHSSTTGYLYMNGPTSQTMSGTASSSYGNVLIDNANGVNATSNLTLSGNLTLQNGVFDIDVNQLILGETSLIQNSGGPFGTTRTIKAFGALTDGGITKSFPAGAFNFTFPVMTGTNYTPAQYVATTNTAPGTMTLKAVYGQHPATTDGANKEMIYYWSVVASGFGGLNVTHTYNYVQPLVNGRGTETSYVGSRYAGAWFSGEGTVNATSNIITFSAKNYLSGEFTAGEFTEFTNGAAYLSNGTGGGNWDLAASWTGNAVPPPGAPVQIQLTDVITVTTNSKSQSITTIDASARLVIDPATTGHNLGTVYGTGTLAVSSTNLPGGNFGNFTAAGGGTIEYSGTGYAMSILRSVYNHVRIVSTGTIDMGNLTTTLNGDLTISSGTFRNTQNKKLIVRGNLVNNGTFTAGSTSTNENLEISGNMTNNGTFTTGNTNTVFRGTGLQTISGTVLPVFTTLQVNKTSGDVKLLRNIQVNKQLTLTRGDIRLFASDLEMYDTTLVKPDVITSQSYVQADQDGRLVRYITSLPTSTVDNKKIFPVGDSVNYTPLNMVLTTATLGVGAKVLVNLSRPQHPLTGFANRYLRRYWRLREVNVTNPVMDLTYQFASSSEMVDLYPVDPRPLGPARYNSGGWNTASPGYDTAAHLLTWNNSLAFGDYTAGTGLGDVMYLPVTLRKLEARPVKEGILVEWETESEKDMEGYTLERQDRNGQFVPLAFVPALQNATGRTRGNSYRFTDLKPADGQNLYRLRLQDLNAPATYTQPVHAWWGKSLAPRTLSVFPNPSDGRQIFASIGGLTQSAASASITTVEGRTLWSGSLDAGPEARADLTTKTSFQPGLYILTLRPADGPALQVRFVVK